MAPHFFIFFDRLSSRNIFGKFSRDLGISSETFSSSFTGSVEIIGKALFGQFLLPFELISILLLLAVFAAVSLAKKDVVAK